MEVSDAAVFALTVRRSTLGVSWKRRLELLFDDGQYGRAELPRSFVDPLKFRDLKRYTDRLKESQSKTSEADAIVVAYGRLGGQTVVAAVFNFEFMGGSMGTAVGDGLIAAAELAVDHFVFGVLVVRIGAVEQHSPIAAPVEDLLTRDGPMLACEAAWLA